MFGQILSSICIDDSIILQLYMLESNHDIDISRLSMACYEHEQHDHDGVNTAVRNCTGHEAIEFFEDSNPEVPRFGCAQGIADNMAEWIVDLTTRVCPAFPAPRSVTCMHAHACVRTWSCAQCQDWLCLPQYMSMQDWQQDFTE